MDRIPSPSLDRVLTPKEIFAEEDEANLLSFLQNNRKAVETLNRRGFAPPATCSPFGN